MKLYIPNLNRLNNLLSIQVFAVLSIGMNLYLGAGLGRGSSACLSVETVARAWRTPLNRGAFVSVGYLSSVVLTFVPCTMTVYPEVLLLGTLYGVSA